MNTEPDSRQHCQPMLVSSLDEERVVRRLKPVPYTRGEGDGHNEEWLQALVSNNPELIPISEIEPGFGPLTSICTELPTRAGPVDNLFLTPEGNIVLAECKLWRNEESRRKVIAQIMDYAEAMSGWTCLDLEKAARSRNPELGSLHATVGGDLGEAAFVDAVSRNLALGRVLLVILGDGIREGVERLTGMLQKHAGFHFALALVEMPLFRLPDRGFIVTPRILARTVTIERGIVNVTGEGKVRIDSPPLAEKAARPGRVSISLEQQLEALAANDPESSRQLKLFLDSRGDRAIEMDAGTQYLMLRWKAPDGTQFTLGAITSDGIFYTYYVGRPAHKIGRVDLSHAYLEDLADLIGGQVRKTNDDTEWNLRGSNGKHPPASSVLADRQKLLEVIDRYTDALSEALSE